MQPSCMLQSSHRAMSHSFRRITLSFGPHCDPIRGELQLGWLEGRKGHWYVCVRMCSPAGLVYIQCMSTKHSSDVATTKVWCTSKCRSVVVHAFTSNGCGNQNFGSGARLINKVHWMGFVWAESMSIKWAGCSKQSLGTDWRVCRRLSQKAGSSHCRAAGRLGIIGVDARHHHHQIMGMITTANVQGTAMSDLHPLWRKITAFDSSVFYYNPFIGRVSQEGFPPPAPVHGGILSDEVSFSAETLCAVGISPQPCTSRNQVCLLICISRTCFLLVLLP